jgi:hypothetical protein
MIDLPSPRPLGSTHLTLGRLGLGVAPLGNLHAQVSADARLWSDLRQANLIPAEAPTPPE